MGLVPAAGRAERLGRLPCSKELLAVRVDDGEHPPRPRPVCEHLLGCFKKAGIERAWVLLGSGKWDIPAYLGSGSELGLELAYLTVDSSPGVPHTLDRAFPWVSGSLVALGFPDILFEPRDAFSRVLGRCREGGADVVLGLFPTDRPDKCDMVKLDDAGRVTDIVIKSPGCRLTHTWGIAVWTPVFSHFLHDHLAARRAGSALGRAGTELYVGDILLAATRMGMAVEAVPFEDGALIDIGTPEEYAAASRHGLRGTNDGG